MPHFGNFSSNEGPLVVTRRMTSIFSYLRLGFSLPIFCGVFFIYINLMGNKSGCNQPSWGARQMVPPLRSTRTYGATHAQDEEPPRAGGSWWAMEATDWELGYYQVQTVWEFCQISCNNSGQRSWNHEDSIGIYRIYSAVGQWNAKHRCTAWCIRCLGPRHTESSARTGPVRLDLHTSIGSTSGVGSSHLAPQIPCFRMFR